MKRTCFVLMLLVATNTYAQPLDQFLSHPIESNFASSPDGKSIAWVINDHGKRNILVKTGTDLPRFLTDYPLDDGQEISQLVFSPNGTKLLYVRGSGANPCRRRASAGSFGWTASRAGKGFRGWAAALGR